MGYVPYVGFATYHRVIVMIRLYFKKLMFMQLLLQHMRERMF
jgi:hypothetical protein